MIMEAKRMLSPVHAAQCICFDGRHFWLAARGGPELYKLSDEWRVIETVPAPGSIWGLARSTQGLAVVCGLGNDDRYIYQYSAQVGFTSERVPCPDLTGCYITYDDKEQLWLVQAAYGCIAVLRPPRLIDKIHLKEDVYGICWARNSLFAVFMEEGRYHIGALDACSKALKSLGIMRFASRSLTYDGDLLWSSYRDEDEIVAFQFA